MNVAQLLVSVVVEVLAKDERRHEACERIVAVAGERARLEPRVAFPRAALRDQVMLERCERHGQRAAVAVGAQPHVDPEYVTVGGHFGERGDDAPAETIEELAIGERARAVRLAFLGIREHEVDVRRDVELAAAQLPHADDDEALWRSGFVADGLAVRRGELARMQRRRGVECNFRQRGDRCQHLGERRAPGQVAGKRMHEEAAPQHPQGRREGDAVATFDDRREGVTRGGPVERHVER